MYIYICTTGQKFELIEVCKQNMNDSVSYRQLSLLIVVEITC